MRIAELNCNCNTNFGRKLTAQEMKVYSESLDKGLKLLNKQVDIIIHNSAAPSAPKENTGIGSLFSKTVQEKLIPFLRAHGFTGIQQEPNNLRKVGDPSPYAPESSAKNIFMIPLEKLTTEKYGKILSQKDFTYLIIHRPKTNDVDYQFVHSEYEKALKLAYNNFKKGKVLQPEFQQFREQHSEDLERAAIFNILNNKYKTSWQNWNGIDKKLYSPETEEEIIAAKQRISEIKDNHKSDIDFFMFKQFLIDCENKESNKLAEKTGIKIIGDSPVASPAADEWINQNLFLKGKAIGCPPDYFSPDGQRWGFGYFNPKYIFNPDGSLGEAGKILKAKYDNFFASFPGGLRIDHVIGLVDPFIYTVDAAKMTAQNSGRIYSMEGEFKKKPEEYSNILEKIILQSAKEHGMDKTNLICEDLGDPNRPTQRVMEKLDLSGISVTQFDYRGKEAPEKNVIMVGSHDNPSFIEYTDRFFEEAYGKDVEQKSLLKKIISYYSYKLNFTKNDNMLEHFMTKTKHLAEDTAPQDASRKTKRAYKQQIRNNKRKFMEASFAELFTSPARRVQIFFADFWGLGKTYNRPGTNTGNWQLRIPSDFETEYYKAVSEGKAPNLANAVATALRHRGLDKTNPELINDLDKSAKILYE